MTLQEFYEWIDLYVENGSGTGCWATEEGIQILIGLGVIREV